MMIEKRQRLARLQRLQPQIHPAQLRRHRIQVHPVQTAPDHLAQRGLIAPRRRLALALGLRPHPRQMPRQAMRRADQEMAGTHGGVADFQRQQGVFSE